MTREETLEKLYTFVPTENADQVRRAIFSAGAGKIGNYYDCSFNAEGTGTFTAGEGTHPHIGEIGKAARANEMKVEVVFPSPLRRQVVQALRSTSESSSTNWSGCTGKIGASS